jgi:hypothetical protein
LGRLCRDFGLDLAASATASRRLRLGRLGSHRLVRGDRGWGRARAAQLRRELGAQDLLQLRRNLSPGLGRIATTAPWQCSTATRLRLRLALARRPLVAASWLLSLGLTSRFGVPRRRPSVPLAVDGRGIRAPDAPTPAPALALALALAATAAALLGQQILGDLRLGKVVLVGG